MGAQEDHIKPRSSELFDSETLEQFTGNTISIVMLGLCIYSNVLAYTDLPSDMRTELFKWIDTDVKVCKKVQVLSKLYKRFL